MKSKKTIVLAYSGGLDTSIILKWLQENYNAEVICYTADVGQEIDRKKIISNAKKFGVKNIIIKDLKDSFVKDYVFNSKFFGIRYYFFSINFLANICCVTNYFCIIISLEPFKNYRCI